MRTIITTESVAQADRFDHWVYEMSQVFAGLDTRPVSKGPFQGIAARGSVGSVQLNSISAGPLRVRRTARLCAQYEEDYYKVALQISGTSVVEQGGAQTALGPGDIAICDAARPYSFTYVGDFRTVILLLPRPLLPLRPEAVSEVTAHRISTDEGVGAVVAPFLQSLGEQDRDFVGPAAHSLMDGTVSLLTALVMERLDRAAPHDAMMLRIRAYIEHRLADPELSPDTIAEAHGISRRYLFKLFAAEGTTVAGWIRTRRLEHCARDLANSDAADQPIGMVATRWGLLDHRHFSRVFKSVYGETPREFRRRALVDVTGE
ncbi:helix-turn-helix domain-containing protein [Streptomyces sp. NA02950]|uniref:AraC-like ligand-binding domain-containing protein n=1 Tax=Streptomyces sp. NA02950 TaxID=2742137 RepID=UPI001590E359|nr:helix-turn-helix domain-containing protein [Streptomyces sp. NA02950]QKV93079.1 helix-turn-helix domain-containing protein [Streptomyces sp. NA02950]